MADIRENLIEILRKTRYEYRRYIAMKDYEKRMAKTDEEFCAVDDSIVGEIPFCADYLIANGVTVQEWISVDDRLPKNFVSVLGYMTDAGEFPPVRECYTVGNAFFFPALGDVHPVSHWCEMPQPPKGE